VSGRKGRLSGASVVSTTLISNGHIRASEYSDPCGGASRPSLHHPCLGCE
jgi:hypothetical protein